MTINLSVLLGELSSMPELAVLPTGAQVANLSLRVHGANDKQTSVPVTIWNPPSWVAELDSGQEIGVLGPVTRRFFRRKDGSTASAVAVEAIHLCRRGKKREEDRWARIVEQELGALFWEEESA